MSSSNGTGSDALGRSATSPTASRSKRSSVRSTPRHAASTVCIAMTAVVSVAVVDVAFADDVRGPRLQPILDAAVDLVHRLAGTYGAVHSFVGDRVTVSWNAASRVANPQAKAARFLVLLAKHVGDGELGASTRVSGAAASGPAMAHVAGLGAQRALFVSARGDWVRGLEALRAEAEAARQGGLMLCDDRTRQDAEHTVAMRAAAAVEYAAPCGKADRSRNAARVDADPTAQDAAVPPGTTPSVGPAGDEPSTSQASALAAVHGGIEATSPPPPPPPSVRALGFALLGLRDEGADEWMYVLEGRAAQEAEAQRTEVLLRWARGEVSGDVIRAVL